MNDNQKWEIIQGDALKVLSGFTPNTFDAVITDPRMLPEAGRNPRKTSPPPESIQVWGRTRHLPLMGTPKTSAPGPLGGRVAV